MGRRQKTYTSSIAYRDRLGKTIVFSKILEDRVKENDKCLVLAHRWELLQQAQDKIKMTTGLNSTIEKANETAIDSEHNIVVGSIQTLWSEKRMNMYPEDYFNTIVVDEAHHAVSDGYQKVLNHHPNAKVVGVTATADRGDKRALAEYFDSIAYEYPLKKAIQEGYLCKIKAQTIPLELDITNVGTAMGDYKSGELGHAIEPYLDQIATKMEDYCKDRKTIVFLPLVETAIMFRDILNRHGFKAAEVDAKSKDRTEILKDFEDGKYNVLTNAILLTEGLDIPSIDCVIILRPTKIRSLLMQCIGRATRLYPGKEDCLVLDFLWLTEKHDLARPASLFAETEEIAEEMTKKLESGEMLDMMDLEQEATQEVAHRQEQSLIAALWSQSFKPPKMFDPLDYITEIDAGELMMYSPVFNWENERITEKQRTYLYDKGIYVEPNGISKGQATKLISNIVERNKQGLATPKQVRFLSIKGFVGVQLWTREQASEMMDRIAKNNWNVPYDINPQTYIPNV